MFVIYKSITLSCSSFAPHVWCKHCSERRSYSERILLREEGDAAAEDAHAEPTTGCRESRVVETHVLLQNEGCSTVSILDAAAFVRHFCFCFDERNEQVFIFFFWRAFLTKIFCWCLLSFFKQENLDDYKIHSPSTSQSSTLKDIEKQCFVERKVGQCDNYQYFRLEMPRTSQIAVLVSRTFLTRIVHEPAAFRRATRARCNRDGGVLLEEMCVYVNH